MKSRFSTLLLLIVLAVGVAVLRTQVNLRDHVAHGIEWLRAQGDWGLVWLALAYLPASLFFFPAFLLTLGGSFVFGFTKTIPAVSIGSTLGATVAFLAGRTGLRRFIETKVSRNTRFLALDRAVGRQGFKIVFLTRLSPVLPFNLLNYAFGLTTVRLRDFVLASWIGMLPGTAMYVSIGSAAKSLNDVLMGRTESGLGQKLLFGAGLVATVAVSVVLTRIARQALTASTENDLASQVLVASKESPCSIP